MSVIDDIRELIGGMVKLNGQLYQSCCTVLAAKQVMKTNSAIAEVPPMNEMKIEFLFLPEKKIFGEKKYKASGLTAWYSHCMRKGLKDILLLVPKTVEEREFLGFSNGINDVIACFWEKHSTYFTPYWEYNELKSQWSVLYTEHKWEIAPIEKPKFSNSYDKFKLILTEIAEFADVIEFEDFAQIFRKSVDILEGKEEVKESPFSEMPKENQRFFAAASLADVFGGMGSWNDSPPYAAHEKGMDKEYEILSNELLKQTRLTILYSVNEW